MSTGSLLTNWPWPGSGSVSFGTGGISQRGEACNIITSESESELVPENEKRFLIDLKVLK